MLKQYLEQGLETMGLFVVEEVQQQLVAYLELLLRWNRVYNLTAIDEPSEMVTHHLLDSLALGDFIKGARIIDVGTGAGVPGIPLSLFLPQQQFVLLDSQAKKTRFIQQVVIELGLSNVQVETSRVETFQPNELFDVVIARAFSSLAMTLKQSKHLCNDDGIFVLPKGQYPKAELNHLGDEYQWSTHSINVPNLQNRHVVCVKIT